MIRLSELRKEKGLSQRQMASEFNVSQGTYCNWEKGTTEPSIEQLIAMSNFFGVSVDYLINNTDEIGIVNIFESMPGEAEILRQIRSLSADNRDLIRELIYKLQNKD